jgi:hypothetical protein
MDWIGILWLKVEQVNDFQYSGLLGENTINYPHRDEGRA